MYIHFCAHCSMFVLLFYIILLTLRLANNVLHTLVHTRPNSASIYNAHQNLIQIISNPAINQDQSNNKLMNINQINHSENKSHIMVSQHKSSNFLFIYQECAHWQTPDEVYSLLLWINFRLSCLMNFYAE